MPWLSPTINNQPALPAGRQSTINRKSKGFTLIELLVVITIIALLIGVAAASYTKAQQKARDGKRKSDLKAVQQALEIYFQQNGQYPPLDQNGWCTYISNTSQTAVKSALEGPPTYISKVPTDPTKPNQVGDYFYYRITANTYELASILENTNDPEWGTYPYPGCSGGSTYQYKVTQP